MPDEPWALMAAAQMHTEGRLVDPDSRGGSVINKDSPFDPGKDVADQYQQGNYDPYESAVDKYTIDKKMKENDKFFVTHPNGEQRLYRYLGPNSGGRKDWLELRGAGES